MGVVKVVKVVKHVTSVKVERGENVGEDCLPRSGLLHCYLGTILRVRFHSILVPPQGLPIYRMHHLYPLKNC